MSGHCPYCPGDRLPACLRDVRIGNIHALSANVGKEGLLCWVHAVVTSLVADDGQGCVAETVLVL